MKLRVLFILSLVLFLFLSWRFIDSEKNNNDPETNRLQIRMRDIGHQLLLSAGDTSSRVLPVKQLSVTEYQIEFESGLTLEPETLVSIVHTSMVDLNIPDSYTVNVHDCSTREIVYGFEIYQDETKDVVPCLGRSLPKACYQITIAFQQQTNGVDKYAYVSLSLAFCLVLAFLVLKKSRDEPTANHKPRLDFIQLGKFQFFHQKQLLKWGKNEILLTSKENQVLHIFASNPNQIIDRDQLQKEGWENEGVLVGRSLDVFISKLRKKLEVEPNVRIVNIHGKGYKLEIDRA